MSDLPKAKKIETIRAQSKKFDIKSYEYGKNTSISTMSAHNILTGDIKSLNPKHATLDTMLSYIESKTVGSNINEPGSNYKTLNKRELKDLALATVDYWDQLMKEDQLFKLKFEAEAGKWLLSLKEDMK